MKKALLTPSILAELGVKTEVSVPEYDWKGQQRWGESVPIAGKLTSQSIQTFDGKGKPNDSRSDHND
jgi:hypothetical protein